jgi:hypothetical protein
MIKYLYEMGIIGLGCMNFVEYRTDIKNIFELMVNNTISRHRKQMMLACLSIR